MKVEHMRGYVAAILRGISRFVDEVNSRAEKSGDAGILEDLSNLGIIIVAVDETTGECVIARPDNAKAVTVAAAIAISDLTSVSSDKVGSTDVN